MLLNILINETLLNCIFIELSHVYFLTFKHQCKTMYKIWSFDEGKKII